MFIPQPMGGTFTKFSTESAKSAKSGIPQGEHGKLGWRSFGICFCPWHSLHDLFYLLRSYIPMVSKVKIFKKNKNKKPKQKQGGSGTTSLV